MSQWLLRMIAGGEGGADAVAEIERAQWAWAQPEWLLLGLLLLGPAAWWIIARHRRALGHVAPRPRAVLSACRIGVLGVLVFVLGQPYLDLDERIERKPFLAVAVDESASMDLPAGPFEDDVARRLARVTGLADGPRDEAASLSETARPTLDEQSRTELLDAVLASHADDLLPRLAEQFDLHYYSVGRSTHRLASLDETGNLDAYQRGETGLATVFDQVRDDAAGRPLAGLALLTDGRSTVGEDPVDRLRSLAQREADQSLPIWSVPVGGQAAAPDLAVLDVLAPSRVGLGDSVNILATIAARGFESPTATVRLLEGDDVLDEQTLDFDEAGRQQVELSFTADSPGRRALDVVIEPHDAEPVTANNSRPVSIMVDEHGLKLLYLENAPRWDFRFLDHALRRDNGVETRFVMEQQLRADGVSPDDLPTAAGLAEADEPFADYDLVLLGDISRSLLTDDLLDALVEAVEDEGVGLLVHAGTEHMPHDYLDTPLAELLPMRFNAAGESARGGVEAEAFAPFRMSVTASGAMHPALALYGSAARNRELWNRMPVFYWAADAAEARAGATVIAERTTATGRRPLIASQYVGRGRVMLIGTDSTFRWRRNIGDHLFYRFWGQALRHTARDERRSEDRSWLDLQPRQVEPGSPVTIDLYAVGPDREPLAADELPLSVEDEAGDTQPVQLTRAPDQPEGHYQAAWQARQEGAFTFVFDHQQESPLRATVRVADSGRELLHPTVDYDALAAMADLSGGGVLPLDRLAELPDQLAGEPHVHHRDREVPMWDNWLVLLLLVGLYCTDVAIRRMMGLN